ncbi:BRCA1 C Terminus domain containing protein expressed [Citrus sinensis]|nr:BRCA1 C Terminus domain containing protein expressed [Citrus sinensis]
MPQSEPSAGAGEKCDANKALLVPEVNTSAGAGKKNDSDKVLPLQLAETFACSGESGNQFKIDNNASDMEVLSTSSYPKTEKNRIVRSLVNDQDKVGRREEKFKKVADVNDAVELSISASEALVIHELSNNEPDSEDLLTTIVLEAALQVKQARLENQEDTSHYPNKEIDETHLVSELDDLTMASACEDVGLPSAGSDENFVSGSESFLIKYTPLSENYYESNDNGFKHVECLAHQKKLPADPALNLNGSYLEGKIDPMLHQSTQETSHVLAAAQPEASTNSIYAWNSNNADSGLLLFCLLLLKEVDVPIQLEQSNNKGIPKFYVNETSSLTESADVAPDENSFVQKHETGSKMASQSSIPFEGVNNKADEEISFCQDVISSAQSFVDPLCSFVPCSVSAVDASSPQTINVAAAQKQLLEVENLQRTSDFNAEFINRDRQDVSTFSVEGFENPVKRQLTLLKPYSTLSPINDPKLEKRSCFRNHLVPSECHEEIISLEQNIGCIWSWDKRYCKGLLSFGSASKFAAGRENEETYKTTVTGNPYAVATNCTENNDKLVSHGAGLLEPLKESRLPPFPNRGTCRSHASKLIGDVNNSFGKTNPDEAGVQETVVMLHNLSEERNNYLETQVPIRKRIRLSEVEVDLRQNRDIEKLQSSHKFHSVTRTSEMSKNSNACRDSQLQYVKRCSTTRRKYVKRLIFQGIKFLLTGFSSQKEKEIEVLIQKYGGLVLLDIPPPNSQGKRCSRSHSQQLPVVICPKKLKTTKFLYGCAVNAFILKAKWLTDSVAAGSTVSPAKYMILSSQADLKRTGITEPICRDNHKYIFGRVGIMLHGKPSFCTKFAVIVKHGGGQVFKTLHWLVLSLETQKNIVGVIVAENERRVSRHLRHCAFEKKIAMVPASWIIKSLHIEMLLPQTQDKHIPSPTVNVPEFRISIDWSEEI